MLFTNKYFPKNTSQVFGQQKAVDELKDFVANYKDKKQKIALVYGPIGVGKTSSVYALANELNYEVLEINSSQLRKADNIKSFLDSALNQRSLFFKPKIVLIDEIDNVSGVKDRGCVPALIKAITNSSFPVLATANDPFDQKLKPLRKISQMIEFHNLQYRTISHALQWVCQQEGINFEEKAINSLARQVGGDMRGALIDLQISSVKGDFVFSDVQELSDRKRTQTIINALRIIFKSSSAENALGALNDVDVDIDQVFLWLDYNLPKEYSGRDLIRAYESVARADIFRGRITKRQHWRYLVYVYNLLTAGVSVAKDTRYPEFVQYKQTSRLLRIWQSKMKMAKKKEIAAKLAKRTHVSLKVAMQQVPYLQRIVNDEMAKELDLSDDEVSWLQKY